MQYFIIMVDYGRAGREAVVDPEMTFRGAVEKAREIIGDQHEIAFVHHVQGSSVSDVTEEVVERAQALRLEAAE